MELFLEPVWFSVSLGWLTISLLIQSTSLITLVCIALLVGTVQAAALLPRARKR